MTRRLEFYAREVEVLLLHALNATRHRSISSTEDGEGPRLWLVGDHGVYLMSNGAPILQVDGGDSAVAHAIGINPRLNEFWWDAKQSVYGGDDGADELDMIEPILDQIRQGAQMIRFDVTETSITLLSQPTPEPITAKARRSQVA